MKATIEGETQKEQEWKFPCLGVNDNGLGYRMVVLFSKNQTGVVVSFGGSWKLGEYSNTWQMHEFSLLPSSDYVILQND